MSVRANFADIYLRGMRELAREIQCCLDCVSSFDLSNKLGSIFASHSDPLSSKK